MKKWHGGLCEPFGVKYIVGDVVGCFIDLFDNNISKFYGNEAANQMVPFREILFSIIMRNSK